MPTRPRNNNNNNPSKRGRAIELHGLSCQEIEDVLKGLSEDEAEFIANKFRDNMTALQLAVHYDDIKLARCLILYGADPNLRFNNTDYNAPIHQAVSKNNVEMVKFLLNAGADPTLTRIYEDSSYSPLFIASDNGFTSIVVELLKEESVREHINDSLHESGEYLTPLIIAIIQGHKDVVSILKASGAKLRPEHAYTAADFQNLLRIGARSKSLRQVKTLLDDFDYVKAETESSVAALDVNYFTDEDYSALYNAAVVPDNLEVIQYLLSKGAVLAEGELSDLKESYRSEGKFLSKNYKYFLEPVTTPNRKTRNAKKRLRNTRRTKG